MVKVLLTSKSLKIKNTHIFLEQLMMSNIHIRELLHPHADYYGCLGELFEDIALGDIEEGW
jgi:hypothetical protein